MNCIVGVYIFRPIEKSCLHQWIYFMIIRPPLKVFATQYLKVVIIGGLSLFRFGLCVIPVLDIFDLLLSTFPTTIWFPGDKRMLNFPWDFQATDYHSTDFEPGICYFSTCTSNNLSGQKRLWDVMNFMIQTDFRESVRKKHILKSMKYFV